MGGQSPPGAKWGGVVRGEISTETAMLVAGIRESNENVIRQRLACVWLTYQGYSLYNI